MVLNRMNKCRMQRMHTVCEFPQCIYDMQEPNNFRIGLEDLLIGYILSSCPLSHLNALMLFALLQTLLVRDCALLQ